METGTGAPAEVAAARDGGAPRDHRVSVIITVTAAIMTMVMVTFTIF